MNIDGVDVLASGAILLGADVVCDGFHRDRRLRVQTHVHDDHMVDFDTSKGFQDLIMSEATHGLLIAEFNADLVVRDNLHPLPHGAPRKFGQTSVELLSSGHMLGAVQVVVETAGGARLGYSGDFSWPLEQRNVINCDALVVDSTYGSPESIRRYSQDEAEARFLELVLSKVRMGPIHIRSHRGTIQRALQIIGENVQVPVLCSDHLCKEVAVYQRFGSVLVEPMAISSAAAKAALAERRYVRLYGKGDRVLVDPHGVSIVLSAFGLRGDNPVLEHSERSYRVAMSNHADFNGTLEYVRATGAKRVVTDNTRGHGIELAMAIRSRLAIDAMPSTNHYSHEWGA